MERKRPITVRIHSARAFRYGKAFRLLKAIDTPDIGFATGSGISDTPTGTARRRPALIFWTEFQWNVIVAGPRGAVTA